MSEAAGSGRARRVVSARGGRAAVRSLEGISVPPRTRCAGQLSHISDVSSTYTLSLGSQSCPQLFLESVWASPYLASGAEDRRRLAARLLVHIPGLRVLLLHGRHSRPPSSYLVVAISSQRMGKVERVVFLSLVLDLFAFTIPLPLFPRIIEWYTKREASHPTGFLSRTLFVVSGARGLLYQPTSNPQRWDIVLLGGLMGSVFSALQWFISPHIGSLSDKYGRKRVLLITMIGNLLSALVWLQSTSFASYMLSRVIGGLSEGNVQLAIAILSDVTTPETRAKALAHVGIAFAICFCIGPPIGAYFASRPLPSSFTASGFELNVYAGPAALTLGLLTLETIFLVFALPETRGKAAQKPYTNGSAKAAASGKANGTIPTSRQGTVAERLTMLKSLQRLHFLFLGVFSGVEFTLTFLTFDLFDWNNKQNGALIGSIGIISALLQGGYVRRAMSKVGEGKMAERGVSSCALGLVFLTILPHLVNSNPSIAVRLLQGAAVCMAMTSATVVNALTAWASLQTDDITVDPDTGKTAEEHPELAKGKALGKFRSSGQLGRAIGPLLACASYWTFGPSWTYAISAVAMFALSGRMRSVTKRTLAANKTQ